jgi:DNA-binding transcriptional MerR regulator
MAKYSIKDLERISGIKAHTIRIWEKRYNLVNPERTATNIRFYDDANLRKIINVSILNRNGLKISKIAKLKDKDIIEKVLIISNNSNQSNNVIEHMVAAMIEFDEAKFEKLFSNTVFNSGFENTFINVMYPFFEKVGVLWQTGCIQSVHEHFVSNIIRQNLIVAIQGQNTALRTDSKSFLLYLPEEEFHELGLLFYNYILRKRGYKVLYLGHSVPFSELVSVATLNNINALLTNVNNPPDISGFNDYFKKLAEAFSDKDIYVSGRVIHESKVKLPASIHKINSSSDFIHMLEN